MIVEYVTDVSGWLDWQKDYRLGVILILPPPEVSSLIDPLKARYDPDAPYACPTHVSVSDPLRLEMTPERDAEIARLLRGIDPFVLHFDKPRASREHAGVAYPITPQAPIDALKRALHQAAVFDGKVYRRREIPAHMTIAEFVTIEESFRIVDEIGDSAPRGSFLCDEMAYIVPDIAMRFHVVKTYALGSRQRRPNR